LHARCRGAKLDGVSATVRAGCCAAVLLGACASPGGTADPDAHRTLSQIQTRAFDSTDVDRTVRTVAATLQDLGFVVDKADRGVGTVSGTRFDDERLRTTVLVRRRNDRQVLVRVNVQLDVAPVRDAHTYREFFAALEKSMALPAHYVD
jgi:hypothetical protein